jgi:hypothetical protein
MTLPSGLPPIEYVLEALDREPETNVLRWRVRAIAHFLTAGSCNSWNAKWAGKIAGNVSGGYVRIGLCGGLFLAHRLVWLLVHGEPVPDGIDHADGNPLNNRIDNLRAATGSQNCANRGKTRSNTSGVKGVHLSKETGKFRAYIKRNGHTQGLGSFTTIEEAATARQKAHEELYGAFARHD